jgi:hypothetical protein
LVESTTCRPFLAGVRGEFEEVFADQRLAAGEEHGWAP